MFHWSLFKIISIVVAVVLLAFVIWALIRTFSKHWCVDDIEVCDICAKKITSKCAKFCHLETDDICLCHYAIAENPLVDQPVPNEAFDTTVVFPVETRSAGFKYDPLTGEFVAPEDGLYLITTVLKLEGDINASPGPYYIFVKTSERVEPVLFGQYTFSPSVFNRQTLSGAVLLNKGETFHVVVSQITDVELLVGGTITVQLINKICCKPVKTCEEDECEDKKSECSEKKSDCGDKKSDCDE